jgi:hypothetical protein
VRLCGLSSEQFVLNCGFAIDAVSTTNSFSDEHKALIELVDMNHQVFLGQAKTVRYAVPKSEYALH